MKKWLSIILASILILSLSACNSSSENDSKTNGDSNSTSLEEVYTKAIDRQNEIKSMTSDVKMNMKMKFELNGEELEMNTVSDLKMDMILDPLSMYMTGKMSTGGATAAQQLEVPIDAYMTEDTMFMYEPESKVWYKMSLDGMEELLGQTATQVNSAEQFKALEPFIKDFKMTEEGNQYILTLDTASKKFTDFVLKQMDLYDSLGLSEEEKELMENIKYDKVSYKIKVNKDTFDITAMDMVINMTIESEGQKVVLESDSKMTFSNFDGVKEIKVPQDVIDKAVNYQ